MKRILIIVGILIAAAAIVAVGMLLRDRSNIASPGPSDSLPNGQTLPIADNNGVGTGTGVGDNGGNASNGGTGANGGLPVAGMNVVAQAAVIDYTINPQGVIYISPNGAVISSSSTEPIGQANFDNILGAQFSPDGKWLLIKSGSKNLIVWDILDIAKKTWKGIQANTSEMFWSRSGNQLAYLARRTNGSGLNIYNPATGTVKTLLTLSAPDLTLRWRDASHLLILDRPTALNLNNIWSFETTTSKLTEFSAGISGADILWGGPKSGGLLFRSGSTGGALSIVNSDGSTLQGANFLTFLSKCVFGETAATSTISNMSDYLFCAIPQDQAGIRERKLPDDYLKGKFGTSDTLYAINLISGTLAPIIPASENFNFDATNLKVYGENIYFVNKNDRKLYKVSLSTLAGSPEAGVAGE